MIVKSQWPNKSNFPLTAIFWTVMAQTKSQAKGLSARSTAYWRMLLFSLFPFVLQLFLNFPGNLYFFLILLALLLPCGYSRPAKKIWQTEQNKTVSSKKKNGNNRRAFYVLHTFEISHVWLSLSLTLCCLWIYICLVKFLLELTFYLSPQKHQNTGLRTNKTAIDPLKHN